MSGAKGGEAKKSPVKSGHDNTTLKVEAYKFLAVGSTNSRVQLLCLTSGDQRLILPSALGNAGAMSFSSCGGKMAQGDRDMRVIVCETETGAKVMTVAGHDGEGDCVCDQDTHGICKAVKKGCPVVGHSKEVLGVAVSPDGTTVASAGDDWSVCLWDVASGKLKCRVRHQSEWEDDDAPVKPPHFNSARSVNFSPNGKLVVSASWDKNILIADAETGKVKLTLRGHNGRDGCICDCFPSGGLATKETKPGCPVVGHANYVFDAAFSPDGLHIVSASWDKTLLLWSAEEETVKFRLKGHSAGVYAVVYSPNGKLIASASADKTVRIWKSSTTISKEQVEASEQSRLHPSRAPLYTLMGHTAPVFAVRFTPDSSKLISGGDDENIKVWDSQTGDLCKTLATNKGRIRGLAVAPDPHRKNIGKKTVQRAVSME